MSDSLVTREAPVQTPNGQSERASDTQAQSTAGQQTPDGQSAKETENIKNLQRLVTEKDNAAKQAQQMAQQTQAAYTQLQQRLQQLEDSMAPDDFARMEIQLKRAQAERDQYAAAYQQLTQGQREQQEKLSALQEIADEFGVSVKDLDNATDYKSAVKLALKAQQDKEKRKQETDDDKRERNRADLGGGAPSTAQTKWDDDYADAMRRKDTVAIMRLNRTKGKT